MTEKFVSAVSALPTSQPQCESTARNVFPMRESERTLAWDSTTYPIPTTTTVKATNTTDLGAGGKDQQQVQGFHMSPEVIVGVIGVLVTTFITVVAIIMQPHVLRFLRRHATLLLQRPRTWQRKRSGVAPVPHPDGQDPPNTTPTGASEAVNMAAIPAAAAGSAQGQTPLEFPAHGPLAERVLVELPA